MRLRDLNLRRAYDTGAPQTDVLLDFYVPALSASVRYDRLAGFFSSAALAVAARGIAGLIANGGKMRLVACPQFPRADFELFRAMQDPAKRDDIIASAAIDALDVDRLADEIAADHVRAMGWLLRNERLEIRLAVPRDMDTYHEGLFHQKVGVLSDAEGDAIAYSGSINETAAAWLENIEQFMVFRSWEPSDRELVEFSQRTFDSYWGQSSPNVDVVSLPRAVSQKLISYAPTDIESLDLAEYERRRRAGRAGRQKPQVRLRDYQLAAVDAWFAAGCRGVFEMATGTGKTKTAVECLRRMGAEPGRQLVVVTAPFQHIAAQWVKELDEWGPILAHGGTRWKDQLANRLSEIQLGLRDQVVVVAVQDTAGSSAFSELVGRAQIGLARRVFIGDEVHGLGAPETRRALLDIYTHRLGLSATPTRWFDEEGTTLLEEYFGGVVYTFGIKEALEWKDPETGLSALCPYRYYPESVHLDGDEFEQYMKLTNQIVFYMDKDDPDSAARLEQLYFKRAAVIKTASQKIDALEQLLRRLGRVANALIYCHDTAQLEAAAAVLHRLGIDYHRFTGDEGTTPLAEYGGMSEREHILRGLEDGTYQALVAIKCLDEGVDVPSAALGIILASSSNPREYIQRRGRLLRRAPGKSEATIYDLVVTPAPASLADPAVRKIEHGVLEKELARIREFGESAVNSLSVSTWVLGVLDALA